MAVMEQMEQTERRLAEMEQMEPPRRNIKMAIMQVMMKAGGTAGQMAGIAPVMQNGEHERTYDKSKLNRLRAALNDLGMGHYLFKFITVFC
jgi:hypothetical protein